jgi:hypothetical protein
MPVILATQETKIRRITVRSHPRKIVYKTLSQRQPIQERAGGYGSNGRVPAYQG